MAYSFPLSLAQFFDLLPIAEMTFDLPEAVEIAETGGGEILTADIGTRLWQGEVQLADMEPDEAAEVLAMLDTLRRAGGSLMVHDRSRPWPRADWKGQALGESLVTLEEVASSTRSIRLAGLPAGYQLRRYDYLAFAYGASPTRHALHRIAEPAAADEDGITDLFEVSSNIRPGWAEDASVTLIRASCKAVIVPGSVQPGRRRGKMTSGVTFRFQQTLR